MDWTNKGQKCDKHNKLCMLKTGMREGPTHLKSFFICSELTDSCSFSQAASGIQPLRCPVHGDQYIELQAIIDGHSSKERRKYFRCAASKNKKMWCGYDVLVPKDTSVECEKFSKALSEETSDYRVSSQNSTKFEEQSEIKNLSPEDDHVKIRDQYVTKKQDHDRPCNRPHEDFQQKGDAGFTDKESTIEKPCILPVEALGRLSIKSNEQCDVMKPFKAESNPVQRDRCHDPKSNKMDFVKASSLLNKKLAVTQTSSKVNDSMSYRDSSVIEVSDDDEDDHSKSDRDSENEKDDAGTVGFAGSTDDLNRGRMQETDSSNSQKLPSSGASVINIDHLTAAVSEPKASTVVVIKSSTDEVDPGIKLLNFAQIVTKKEKLVKAMEEYEKLFKSVRGLPDGGKKIKDHIDKLQKEMQLCDKLLSEWSHSHPLQQPAIDPSLRPMTSVLTSSHEATHHPTRVIEIPAQASAYVYQQTGFASGYGNLYGGRMTVGRLEHVGQVTAEAIERLHKQFETCPSSEQEVSDPDGLLVPLLPHQRQALAWLSWREEQHPPGGILADDMGLGKTLTMISLILAHQALSTSEPQKAKAEWLYKESKNKVLKSKATLVICPASLVHQWQKEIERRVKRGLLHVILYHGTNRETSRTSLASADVVITTYNIISKEVGVPEEMKKNKHAQEMPVSDKDMDESASDGGPLLSIFWKRIIIDEAHAIKNHKSLTAMSVSRLRGASRWALTGTPIHNDLLDMYSLLRFLRCSPFDEYKLWKRQVDNKTEKGTQRLNTLIKTLLLRRTKDQTCPSTGCQLVALPKKHTQSHELKLSSQERQLYDRIFKQSRDVMQEYLQRHEDKILGRENGSVNMKPANPWMNDNRYSLQSCNGSSVSSLATAVKPGVQSSSGRPVPPGGGQILINLLRLRQCCSHMYLLRNALEADDLQSDGMELDLVEQMNELALSEATGVKDVKVEGLASSANVDSPSTKVTALLNELLMIRQNSSSRSPVKSVVVSQWTKMLEIVEFHLKREGFRSCTIKGSVAPKQRSDMVDTFNSDPSGPEVMLISLRAGGVGLNLIGGNHLFLIDMHWNPALELQACDRIYRVGQKKDVFIHRFICKDTIEEKIVQLQHSKTALANNILSGKNASNNKLTLTDLRLLFGIGPAEHDHRGFTPSF